MKRRTLLVTLIVLVLAIVVLSQSYSQQPVQPGTTIVPQTTPLSTPPTVIAVQPTIVPPAPPLPVTPTIPVVQPVKEKTLDQLLDELETLRKQKAELEKKEQDLIKVVLQKADKQAERLKQLGIIPKVTSGEPLRIGRIFTEGLAEKDEKKIMKMLDFAPGQILEYPMLEQARTRLIKAGYQLVTVEVQPKQPDAQYLDILVKVGEKEK